MGLASSTASLIRAQGNRPDNEREEKNAGVCGGEACLGDSRIMVWLLVALKNDGRGGRVPRPWLCLSLMSQKEGHQKRATKLLTRINADSRDSLRLLGVSCAGLPSLE